MASPDVGGVLDECVSALRTCQQPSAEDKQQCCKCKDLLCPELASLLQEAVEMKWPFAPEKWQYKQSLSASDKTNLNDLIAQHISPLLAVLKASITAQEPRTSLAVIFLVDRFLYWMDESDRLLRITKLLHRRYPGAPVAPQLVIRQARLYLNSGKLRKAEYILSSLINNSGATGCWVYHSKSDMALVQAVSIQVRGMILQKLGLWLEAAELIWASLVGYCALPQPDKKGIGTSLGLLANILVSMNDEDFYTFRARPDIDLMQSLLGEQDHRLLSAAQAAKMAVVYSQYTSLYVLTNAVAQGTSLLSYSFSAECPAALKQSFLLQAREAFSVALLTKAQGEVVTSKQELHTFIKAAYSLTVTHKWLGITPLDVLDDATQTCRKALTCFSDYDSDACDKNGLCAEIMKLVSQVRQQLQVKPFLKSDDGSFIPDSYRNVKESTASFTLEGFARLLQRFQKYHTSLCETTHTECHSRDQRGARKFCITALGTTVGTVNTEYQTEANAPAQNSEQVKEAKQPGRDSHRKFDLCTTQGSTEEAQSLGSSWQNISLSHSGFNGSNGDRRSAGIGQVGKLSNQSCQTTVSDDDLDNIPQFDDHQNNSKSNTLLASSHKVMSSASPPTSSSSGSSVFEKLEVIQAGIETLGTEEDWVNVVSAMPQKPPGPHGAAQHVPQLISKTPSSSLSDSFTSQSSWEKVPADFNDPKSQTKVETSQTKKSSESDGSFFLLETMDSECFDSACDLMQQNHASEQQIRESSSPQCLQGVRVEQVSVKPVSKKPLTSLKPNPPQCTSTEPYTESSYEVLVGNEDHHQTSNDNHTENACVPEKNNNLCFNCKYGTFAATANQRQYWLSQQDYKALLAGVCNGCLLKRLHSGKSQFELKEHQTVHDALHLKFSKATGLWTAKETCAYIGEPTGKKGQQRRAIWVTFLHQEERLSSYVGKDYLKPKEIQFHLKDVERQMTAQYYVTEFNKSLYDKEVMAQIFFIPSEALLILEKNEIVGCVTVEPYMLGDFVKLTNNTVKKEIEVQATDYGLAFGHFTYLLSGGQEVVVDLQGWVTANGKGVTYLTDPQIHSTKTPKGPSNFADKGLRYFVEEQHGPECNAVCQLLKLPPLCYEPRPKPQ